MAIFMGKSMERSSICSWEKSLRLDGHGFQFAVDITRFFVLGKDSRNVKHCWLVLTGT